MALSRQSRSASDLELVHPRRSVRANKGTRTDNKFDTEIEKQYTLKHEEALMKKCAAADRPGFSAVMKHNNFVLELSASAYEYYKCELDSMLQCKQGDGEIKVTKRAGKDRGDAICDIFYQVVGTGKVTQWTDSVSVNLYQTTCRVLANGNALQAFIDLIHTPIDQNAPREMIKSCDSKLRSHLERSARGKEMRIPRLPPLTSGTEDLTIGDQRAEEGLSRQIGTVMAVENEPTHGDELVCEVCNSPETNTDLVLECMRCTYLVHERCAEKASDYTTNQIFICNGCRTLQAEYAETAIASPPSSPIGVNTCGQPTMVATQVTVETPNSCMHGLAVDHDRREAALEQDEAQHDARQAKMDCSESTNLKQVVSPLNTKAQKNQPKKTKEVRKQTKKDIDQKENSDQLKHAQNYIIKLEDRLTQLEESLRIVKLHNTTLLTPTALPKTASSITGTRDGDARNEEPMRAFTCEGSQANAHGHTLPQPVLPQPPQPVLPQPPVTNPVLHPQFRPPYAPYAAPQPGLHQPPVIITNPILHPPLQPSHAPYAVPQTAFHQLPVANPVSHPQLQPPHAPHAAAFGQVFPQGGSHPLSNAHPALPSPLQPSCPLQHFTQCNQQGRPTCSGGLAGEHMMADMQDIRLKLQQMEMDSIRTRIQQLEQRQHLGEHAQIRGPSYLPHDTRSQVFPTMGNYRSLQVPQPVTQYPPNFIHGPVIPNPNFMHSNVVFTPNLIHNPIVANPNPTYNPVVANPQMYPKHFYARPVSGRRGPRLEQGHRPAHNIQVQERNLSTPHEQHGALTSDASPVGHVEPDRVVQAEVIMVAESPARVSSSLINIGRPLRVVDGHQVEATLSRHAQNDPVVEAGRVQVPLAENQVDDQQNLEVPADQAHLSQTLLDNPTGKMQTFSVNVPQSPVTLARETRAHDDTTYTPTPQLDSPAQTNTATPHQMDIPISSSETQSFLSQVRGMGEKT